MLIQGDGAGSARAPCCRRCARTRATSSGWRCFAAAGRRRERDFAFGIVLQLFEARLARAGEEERASLLSGTARQALPLFESGPRSVPCDPSFELLHDVYRLCVKLAERGPLLLTVDDVDQADDASLRFLIHLAARLEELPAALVLTAGSAPAREAHPLTSELARDPATLRSTLAPLSLESTARRVRETWLPGAPENVCRALHDASAGNPFLIDELAGALVAGNGSAGLTASGVRALAPASVCDWALGGGRASRPGRARAAQGALDARPGGRASARRRSRAARRGAGCDAGGRSDRGRPAERGRAALLRPAGGRHGGRKRAFRPSSGSRLHRRASRILAAEDVPVQAVAAHLMAATRTGSGWAVEALCEAASESLGAGSPADAVRYLRRALDEPPPRRLRTRVVFELGCAEARAGEPEAAGRLQRGGRVLTCRCPAISATRSTPAGR